VRLKIMLPTEILLDVETVQVNAEAQNGAFTLLPRHVDFTAALVPGLLSYITEDDREEFVALDEGILVKVGQEVLISTRNGALGPDLGKLEEMINQQFAELDEHERQARSAFARMEADLVRRFIELDKGRHA
jgi:F-type H+-transporting ATPase subunit epsilon